MAFRASELGFRAGLIVLCFFATSEGFKFQGGIGGSRVCRFMLMLGAGLDP